MIAPARRRRRAGGARVRRGVAVPRRRVRRRARDPHRAPLARPRARAARDAARRAPPGDPLLRPTFVERLLARRRLLPRDRRARRRERAGYTVAGDRATCSTCARVEPVPVPADCIDGFAACYWNRPEAYLDPDGAGRHLVLRAARPRRAARGAPSSLRADLASGAWDARHGAPARRSTELDVGYRLLVAAAELDRYPDQPCCASSCRRARSRRRRSNCSKTPTSRSCAPPTSTTAPRIDDPRVIDVTILRPQEIPRYVADGLFDLGVTGRDWIEETGVDVVDAHASCTTRRRPRARSAWCSRSPATRRGSR